MTKGADGAPWSVEDRFALGLFQPPQWRTGPQSMWTKFDRE